MKQVVLSSNDGKKYGVTATGVYLRAQTSGGPAPIDQTVVYIVGASVSFTMNDTIDNVAAALNA